MKKKLLISSVLLASLASSGVDLVLANSNTIFEERKSEIAEETKTRWTANSKEVIEDNVENYTDEDGYYLIHWGDTLSGISQATGISVANLAKVNGIDNIDLIYAGDLMLVDAKKISQLLASNLQVSKETRQKYAQALNPERKTTLELPDRVTPAQEALIPSQDKQVVIKTKESVPGKRTAEVVESTQESSQEKVKTGQAPNNQAATVETPTQQAPVTELSSSTEEITKPESETIDIQAEIDRLQTELSNAEAKAEGLLLDIEVANQKAESLASEKLELENQLAESQSNQAPVRTTADELQIKLDQANSETSRLRAELEAAQSKALTLEAQAQTAQAEVDRLVAAQADSETETQALLADKEQALKEAQELVNQQAAEVEKLQILLADAGEASQAAQLAKQEAETARQNAENLASSEKALRQKAEKLAADEAEARKEAERLAAERQEALEEQKRLNAELLTAKEKAEAQAAKLEQAIVEKPAEVVETSEASDEVPEDPTSELADDTTSEKDTGSTVEDPSEVVATPEATDEAPENPTSDPADDIISDTDTSSTVDDSTVNDSDSDGINDTDQSKIKLAEIAVEKAKTAQDEAHEYYDEARKNNEGAINELTGQLESTWFTLHEYNKLQEYNSNITKEKKEAQRLLDTIPATSKEGEAAKDKLQAELNKVHEIKIDSVLNGETVLFLGDSFSRYRESSENMKFYHEVIAEITGMNDLAYGVDSIGFGNAIDGYEGAPLYTLSANSDFRGSFQNADAIVLFAGTNDWDGAKYKLGTKFDTVDDETVAGFVNETLDNLMEITDRILVISPTWRTDKKAEGNPDKKFDLPELGDKLVEIGKERNIPVLNMVGHNTNVITYNPWLKEEQTHIKNRGLLPNDKGNLEIANTIWPFLENNYDKGKPIKLPAKTAVVEPTDTPTKGETQDESVLAGQKIAFIGDSITDENETANKKYHDIISEKTKVVVIEEGVDSSGYGPAFNESNTFKNRLENLSKSDPNLDGIVFFGGTNDWAAEKNSLAELGTIMIETLTKAQQLFPTAHKHNNIFVLTPLKRAADEGAPHTGKKNDIYEKPNRPDGFTLAELAKKQVEVANNLGIPVLDLYHTDTGFDPTNDAHTLRFDNSGPDGLHPSNEGHIQIADDIQAFLEKTFTPVNRV